MVQNLTNYSLIYVLVLFDSVNSQLILINIFCTLVNYFSVILFSFLNHLNIEVQIVKILSSWGS